MPAARHAGAVVAAFTLAAAVSLATASTAQAEGNAAAATAVPLTTGSDWCCNAVTTADNPTTQQLLALLGVQLPPGTTGLVGLSCSPITVLGGGGAGCTGQLVYCTGGNTFNGIIVTGCSPTTVAFRRE